MTLRGSSFNREFILTVIVKQSSEDRLKICLSTPCGSMQSGLKVFAATSSPPSAAYMHQWIGTALFQIRACRLFGAQLLPEPMLAYCHLDSWEQISVKFELEIYHFNSRKCISNCRLPKWRPFCPRGDELISRCLPPVDVGSSVPVIVMDAV